MGNGDLFQTKINQLSLVMTMQEDIVKACKGMNMSPAFTEQMIRLHHQQVELEKAVNDLRTIMTKMASMINMQADAAVNLSSMIQDLAKNVGYDSNEQVSSEEIVKG